MSTAGKSSGLARLPVATALGDFLVVASDRGLRSLTPLRAAGAAPHDTAPMPTALRVARAAAAALCRYAAGDAIRHDASLDVAASAFHVAVWDRVRAIPFGATATYREIAAALGMPGEARAVGGAVAANPVCILVPCHRVVGSDGSLRGFAWGLDLKRRLLAHEGRAILPLFSDETLRGWSSPPRA